MSYTLIDYFKAFHTMKEQLNLSAGSQAVYFSLLGEFNAARFPERLSLSDRALKTLAGLKSVATAHECKNVLKNKGLINFTSSCGVTSYQLSTEHLPNTYRTPTEQEANGTRTPDTAPYIRAREDVKTLDVKTLTATAATRAREPQGSENVPGDKDADEFDAFVDDWADSPVFCRLDFELISELKILADKYGVKALRETMTAAKKANGKSQGVSFDFFKAVLERRQNSQLRLVKGGEKRASKPQKQGYAYAPAPEYDVDFESD